MKRVFAVVVAAALAFSAITTGSAVAGPKGAIQLGVGGTQFNGAAMTEIKFDVLTLHAGAMYFPAPWAALIADLSYGLPHDYEMKHGTDSDKITMESSYVDVMAGACRHFTDGGFVYVGAGASMSWSGLEVSDSEGDYEINSGVGFVLGAGLQVPIRDSFMGYAGFRNRYISTEFESGESTASLNSGGFEMTAGIAFAFGG